MWITGLSGAGKSTVAKEVATRLISKGEAVVLLDGDVLREVFGATNENAGSHSRESRLSLAFQYSRLCNIIARQELTVVIATISLFREVHTWNRKNLPGYFEVYLDVPLEELRRRDPKGIYRRFDNGQLTQVAGLDLPIDEPEDADRVVRFDSSQSASEIADELFNAWCLRSAT